MSDEMPDPGLATPAYQPPGLPPPTVNAQVSKPQAQPSYTPEAQQPVYYYKQASNNYQPEPYQPNPYQTQTYQPQAYPVYYDSRYPMVTNHLGQQNYPNQTYRRRTFDYR
jgi:hypothetical protein